MKKILINFIILFVSVVPIIASANLEITEIMYDPKGANTNHQWVEVYNNGSASTTVDASKWRFNDGSSHYMNNKVGFSVSAGGYFILTGDKNTFTVDHPDFTGTVIDTSMALDKDGGVVSLLNDGQVVDTVTYSSTLGAAEDGNSLQKSGSVWLASSPTIGSAYQTNSPVVAEQQNQNDQNTSNDSNSSSETVVSKPKTTKISTEIIAKNIVSSSVDFKFKQKTWSSSNDNIDTGRLIWNFGDGVSRDTSDFDSAFPYRYDYPGEYLVTLSYYKDYFSEDPESTDKLLIRVMTPSLVISSVGTIDNPYVEIENKSSYELNISGWRIQGLKNSFNFALGTTIMPGKKIKLPSRITGLDARDISAMSVYSPAGEMLSTYPAANLPATDIKIQNKKSSTAKSVNKKPSDKYTKVINLDNIAASASKSGVDIPWHIIILVSGVAMFGVGLYLYYLSRPGGLSVRKDNLDSKIRPEDIDILE